MTEKELLQAVRDLAKLRSWLVYHTHRSDRSEPGFPDLIMVHPRTGQFLAIELKSATGRLSADQRRWLDALRTAGITAEMWRPEDLQCGHVARLLTPADVRGAA